MWFTGLVVAHPCEAVFSTKESCFVCIACSYYEYVAKVHWTEDLMTFELRFCPKCGVIDRMVVKSPPIAPPVLGWGGGGALL